MGGLTLRLQADGELADPSAIRLDLELMNAADRRVIVHRQQTVCDHVRWPAFVDICFQMSGMVRRYSASSTIDLEFVHPHEPVSLEAFEALRYSVRVPELSSRDVSVQTLLSELAGAKEVTVWSEMKIDSPESGSALLVSNHVVLGH